MGVAVLSNISASAHTRCIYPLYLSENILQHSIKIEDTRVWYGFLNNNSIEFIYRKKCRYTDILMIL